VIDITKNAPKRGIFSLYNSINCRKIKATIECGFFVHSGLMDIIWLYYYNEPLHVLPIFVKEGDIIPAKEVGQFQGRRRRNRNRVKGTYTSK